MCNSFSMQQSKLISPTGARLNLYSSRPAQAPKASVHITHGLAEHAARYAWFAEVLTQHGFAVYAHDLRGHGHTKSDEAPLGLFAPTGGLDKVMADHDCVLDHIGQEHPDMPIFCFGHSLGSILVLNYAIRQPNKLAGIACWNSGLETGFLPRIGKLHMLRLPKALPIFLLGGAHDPCTNFGKDMQNLERKLTALQCQNVRCDILENTRHESLNEINRATTGHLFVDWLQTSLRRS
jgi:alpha-beta hydrolase superfamily lysophospholipase